MIFCHYPQASNIMNYELWIMKKIENLRPDYYYNSFVELFESKLNFNEFRTWKLLFDTYCIRIVPLHCINFLKVEKPSKVPVLKI